MKIIGHRGAAAYAPENTFASFNKALEIGVDAIETDVQMTKDRQLVLFHDSSLQRVANQTSSIQEKNWDDLKNLDVGSWFDKHFSSERIPLLSETLKRYKRTVFEIEIKQPNIENEILNCIKTFRSFETIIITSFDFETVSKVKKNYPQIKVGFLTSDISEKNIVTILQAHIDQICPEANLLDKKVVNQFHALGLTVRAWGVNNVDLMKQVIQSGADGMTVDFPDLLIKEIKTNQRN